LHNFRQIFSLTGSIIKASPSVVLLPALTACISGTLLSIATAPIAWWIKALLCLVAVFVGLSGFVGSMARTGHAARADGTPFERPSLTLWVSRTFFYALFLIGFGLAAAFLSLAIIPSVIFVLLAWSIFPLFFAFNFGMRDSLATAWKYARNQTFHVAKMGLFLNLILGATYFFGTILMAGIATVLDGSGLSPVFSLMPLLGLGTAVTSTLFVFATVGIESLVCKSEPQSNSADSIL
jgi:hypothetical protein